MCYLLLLAICSTYVVYDLVSSIITLTSAAIEPKPAKILAYREIDFRSFASDFCLGCSLTFYFSELTQNLNPFKKHDDSR